MDTLKQLLFFTLFMILGTSFGAAAIQIIQKISRANDVPEFLLWQFFISFPLFVLLIVFAVRDEIGDRNEYLRFIKVEKKIIDFYYTQAEWVKFATILYKDEKKKYYKIFYWVASCLILFLGFLFYNGDYGLSNTFLFFISISFLPIHFAYVFKFRKRKKAYFDEIKPNIKVTKRGLVINSKIAHSFDRLTTRLYSVEVAEYASRKCIKVVTFAPSPNNGGGDFKTSFIPIPLNEEKNINKPLKKMQTWIDNRL